MLPTFCVFVQIWPYIIWHSQRRFAVLSNKLWLVYTLPLCFPRCIAPESVSVCANAFWLWAISFFDYVSPRGPVMQIVLLFGCKAKFFFYNYIAFSYSLQSETGADGIVLCPMWFRLAISELQQSNVTNAQTVWSKCVLFKNIWRL